MNLIAADPLVTRRFYELLGFTFRAISTPGHPDAAYLSTSPGPGLAIHSVAFARWWDPSTPGVCRACATVFDLNAHNLDALDAACAVLASEGFTFAEEPRDMEFGERYAIVLDPDGRRVGLRARLHH